MTGAAAGEIIRDKVSNETFLRTIFGDAHFARAHVTGFLEDPGELDSLNLRHYWGGGPFGTMARHLTPESNNYFTVSLFSGSKRRKREFETAHVLVIDDVGSAEDVAAGRAKVDIANVPLDSTWAIETSPGNCQLGFLFPEPETRARKFNGLVDLLVEKGLDCGGKDPGMKGVTRYARLPVGRNTKARYGPPGHDHVVKVWEPSRCYTLEQIADAWGVRVEFDALPEGDGGGSTFASGAGGTPAPGEDPIYDLLGAVGKLRGELKDGTWDIECPFIEDHTGRADSGAAYLGNGMFKCYHGHCVDRPSEDFVAKLRELAGPEEWAKTRAAHLDALFGDIGGSRDPLRVCAPTGG